MDCNPIDDTLLGFGWYGAEASDTGLWYWSRDVAEIKTRNLEFIQLSFFTKYEELVGRKQHLMIVCNGRIRDRFILTKGYQTIGIKCEDADEIYLLADAFRPAEHDRDSSDGRSLGIAITGISHRPNIISATDAEPATRHQLVPNGPPIMTQLEISTACHLACVMCSRSARSGGRGEHMTDIVWDRLSTIIPVVEQVNILGTGEPWTHPKFLDWLEFIDQHGVLTHITTSGDLINEARASRLGHLQHLRTMTFSVDSPDPDVYFSIRGQKLERALSGIRRTLENVKDPNIVRIHAVVMRSNLQSIGGFPRLMKEMGIRRLVVRGVNNTKHTTRDMVPDYTPQERGVLIDTRKAAESLGISVSMFPTLPTDLLHAAPGDNDDEVPHSTENLAGDEADSAIDDASQITQDSVPLAKPDMALHFGEPRNRIVRQAMRTAARLLRHEKKLPESLQHYLDQKVARSRHATTKVCLDPWEKFFVTRQGDIYPCEAYHLQSSIGSLANNTAEDIWFGEAYKQFRQSLLDGTNVGCRNCERRAAGVHPFKRFAAEIVSTDIHIGGKSLITLRNMGEETWGDKVQIGLATSRPRDRMASQLIHSSWISRNRLCYATEKQVSPGDLATFRFVTSMPKAFDKPETLQFVAEGYCWLPNTEISVNLAKERAHESTLERAS
jgi:radical SAM protein with 4Fe4S-binding SPASM domain